MVCMFAGLLLGFLGFMVWCGWFWVWFVVGLLLFCCFVCGCVDLRCCLGLFGRIALWKVWHSLRV